MPLVTIGVDIYLFILVVQHIIKPGLVFVLCAVADDGELGELGSDSGRSDRGIGGSQQR